MRRTVLLVALLVTAGCGSPAPESAAAPATSAPATATGSCPAARAEPDPDRPVVDLRFRLDEDLRTVTGTETVVFTPDVPTGELVFRLVPNGPDSTALGNQLTVTAARGEDVSGSGYEGAGAADPGGLYVVTLDGPLAAGES